MADLEISLRFKTDKLVVRVVGSVDMAAGDRLRTEVESALTASTSKVVIDMSGVDYIDSHGLSMILGLERLMKERGGSMELTKLTPEVKKLFDITGISRAVTIIEDGDR